jgi:hypothetical protein
VKETINIIPVLLYIFAGGISLNMALKNLLSNKFLPFHEKAVGKQLNELDTQLQFVILALMKVSGLGFLLLSILLMVFPLYNYFSPNTVIKYSIPSIAIIYCMGLFIINYSLYKNAKTETPWKKTLFVICILIIGMCISLFE